MAPGRGRVWSGVQGEGSLVRATCGPHWLAGWLEQDCTGCRCFLPLWQARRSSAGPSHAALACAAAMRDWPLLTAGCVCTPTHPNMQGLMHGVDEVAVKRIKANSPSGEGHITTRCGGQRVCAERSSVTDCCSTVALPTTVPGYS